MSTVDHWEDLLSEDDDEETADERKERHRNDEARIEQLREEKYARFPKVKSRSTFSAPKVDDKGETVLDLSSLPSDVIRNIIGKGKECIETMKLISHRWHTLALDHSFTNRTTLPSIESFSWHIDKEATMRIRVPQEHRFFLGIDKWSKCADNRTVSLRYDDSVNERKRERFDRLNRLLSRCSRIEKLELRMNLDQRGPEIDVLLNALNGVIVDKLIVLGLKQIDEDTISAILSILRSLQVGSLVLPIENINCMRHGTFISEAVRLVSEIEINPGRPLGNNSLSVTWQIGGVVHTMRDIWRNMERWLNGNEGVKAVFEEEPFDNWTSSLRISIRSLE